MRTTLVGLVVLLAGCHPGGVTPRRLEQAIAPTFANLVEVQESRMGLAPVRASALRASATCHKVGAAADAGGGGSWKCTVVWFAPGHKEPLFDVYDLGVTTDGCFTATADGAEAHVGGPKVSTPGGTSVTNLLYVFDGCFDPT